MNVELLLLDAGINRFECLDLARGEQTNAVAVAWWLVAQGKLLQRCIPTHNMPSSFGFTYTDLPLVRTTLLKQSTCFSDVDTVITRFLPSGGEPSD